MITPRKKTPPEVRFWRYVTRGAPDACWLWTGATNGVGYGVIRIDGRGILAHRFAWELRHGRIPTGMFACHRCDSPGCVNDSHIFIGTHAENMRDMSKKGRNHTARSAGEVNGRAVLDEASVRAIRGNPLARTNPGAVAAGYGVCVQSIRNVVQRITWRHVE